MNDRITDHDHYLVNHGKNGALGSFRVQSPLSLRRGEKVIVEGPLGLEVGTILGPASIRQSRLLGDVGQIVRRFQKEDEEGLSQIRPRADEIFSHSRDLARDMALDLEVLDVDVSLDGGQAILLVVAGDSVNADSLIVELEGRFHIDIKVQNLVGQSLAVEPEEEGGCGKPDCGKSEGGGCSSCSSGGGCATGCGSGGASVDLRDYFAHLRTKMEAEKRVPLL